MRFSEHAARSVDIYYAQYTVNDVGAAQPGCIEHDRAGERIIFKIFYGALLIVPTAAARVNSARKLLWRTDQRNVEISSRASGVLSTHEKITLSKREHRRKLRSR